MRSHLQRLYHLFGHEDRLLILIDPDPDAIASALALKRLLWRRISACVIATIRPITRAQNRRMVQLLNISLAPLNELNPGDFNRRALVDGQPSHNEAFGGCRYDVIIDHHPRALETRAPFLDIRPQYGATSTIMTEYLREARIKPSLKLATALYYGIKTDTSNFERPAIEADVRAFHYLYGFTRRPLVRRLDYAEFNLSMLGSLRLALNRFSIHHNRLYAFLGPVVAPDILVVLADFFLRAGEISWTIVGGVYHDKLVVIFRNDGVRKNAGRLAARAFGKLGSAGGHAASARAEVPMEHIDMDIGAGWQEWQDYLVHRVEGHGRLRVPAEAKAKDADKEAAS